VFDAQQVIEEIGDGAFEAIERAERVFPDGEEEVHRKVGLAQKARQLLGEGPRAAFTGMILEILLELIENNQQDALRGFRPALQEFTRPLGRVRSPEEVAFRAKLWNIQGTVSHRETRQVQ